MFHCVWFFYYTGFRGRGRGFGPHDGWGGSGYDGPRKFILIMCILVLIARLKLKGFNPLETIVTTSMPKTAARSDRLPFT